MMRAATSAQAALPRGAGHVPGFVAVGSGPRRLYKPVTSQQRAAQVEQRPQDTHDVNDEDNNDVNPAPGEALERGAHRTSSHATASRETKSKAAPDWGALDTKRPAGYMFNWENLPSGYTQKDVFMLAAIKMDRDNGGNPISSQHWRGPNADPKLKQIMEASRRRLLTDLQGGSDGNQPRYMSYCDADGNEKCYNGQKGGGAGYIKVLPLGRNYFQRRPFSGRAGNNTAAPDSTRTKRAAPAALSAHAGSAYAGRTTKRQRTNEPDGYIARVGLSAAGPKMHALVTGSSFLASFEEMWSGSVSLTVRGRSGDLPSTSSAGTGPQLLQVEASNMRDLGKARIILESLVNPPHAD